MDKTFKNIDICKISDRYSDSMMFYQLNTYITILHIIVLAVSIVLRLATINDKSYETSQTLNKIASELETANQIRIVENCMNCGFSDSDCEESSEGVEDNEDNEGSEDIQDDNEDNEGSEDIQDDNEDNEGSEDNEDIQDDNEGSEEDGRISEILNEIERISARKNISYCNNLDVTEIAATPAAMESKSEEDSIESAHSCSQ
jgi:hypothetical protein